jgi:hypothetical protein
MMSIKSWTYSLLRARVMTGKSISSSTLPPDFECLISFAAFAPPLTEDEDE